MCNGMEREREREEEKRRDSGKQWIGVWCDKGKKVGGIRCLSTRYTKEEADEKE